MKTRASLEERFLVKEKAKRSKKVDVTFEVMLAYPASLKRVLCCRQQIHHCYHLQVSSVIIILLVVVGQCLCLTPAIIQPINV